MMMVVLGSQPALIPPPYDAVVLDLHHIEIELVTHHAESSEVGTSNVFPPW